VTTQVVTTDVVVNSAGQGAPVTLLPPTGWNSVSGVVVSNQTPFTAQVSGIDDSAFSTRSLAPGMVDMYPFTSVRGQLTVAFTGVVSNTVVGGYYIQADFGQNPGDLGSGSYPQVSGAPAAVSSGTPFYFKGYNAVAAGGSLSIHPQSLFPSQQPPGLLPMSIGDLLLQVFYAPDNDGVASGNDTWSEGTFAPGGLIAFIKLATISEVLQNAVGPTVTSAGIVAGVSLVIGGPVTASGLVQIAGAGAGVVTLTPGLAVATELVNPYASTPMFGAILAGWNTNVAPALSSGADGVVPPSMLVASATPGPCSLAVYVSPVPPAGTNVAAVAATPPAAPYLAMAAATWADTLAVATETAAISIPGF
jgi:hypothetical protein